MCWTGVRVIVRGKAGAEVEFGNTVLVGENRQGIILDDAIFRESAPADRQLLLEGLLRVWGVAGRQVGTAVTDRGFASAANSRALADSDTVDATFPRNPEIWRQKMQAKTFERLQRRRWISLSEQSWVQLRERQSRFHGLSQLPSLLQMSSHGCGDGVHAAQDVSRGL